MKDNFNINWMNKENKDLAKKIPSGEARDGQELYGIKAVIEEVRYRIHFKDNSISIEVIHEENEVFLFLKMSVIQFYYLKLL